MEDLPAMHEVLGSILHFREKQSENMKEQATMRSRVTVPQQQAASLDSYKPISCLNVYSAGRQCVCLMLSRDRNMAAELNP